MKKSLFLMTILAALGGQVFALTEFKTSDYAGKNFGTPDPEGNIYVVNDDAVIRVDSSTATGKPGMEFIGDMPVLGHTAFFGSTNTIAFEDSAIWNTEAYVSFSQESTAITSITATEQAAESWIAALTNTTEGEQITIITGKGNAVAFSNIVMLQGASAGQQVTLTGTTGTLTATYVGIKSDDVGYSLNDGEVACVLSAPSYDLTSWSLVGKGLTVTPGVTLTGGTVSGTNFYGNGTVTLAKGTATEIKTVYGKYVESGDVSDASVNMTKGNLDGDIYGGFSNAGNVSGSTVTIDDGTVGGKICGGYSTEGNAAENSVTINGGEVKKSVYGCYTVQGTANGNTVTITDGTVSGDVWGGYTKNGTATENSVIIKGGTVKRYIQAGESFVGDVTDNTITIEDGTLEKDVYGGYANNGKVSGNAVTIKGGEVNGKVYGGYSYTGDANGNTVTISGGEVGGNVYGGFSENGDAYDNTVNLVGEGATLGELTGSSFTISGQMNGGAGKLVKTNSTLNVYGKGITADSLVHFDVFNFYLTPGTQNGDTMLTLTGTLNTDLKKSRTVNVKCSGATQLKGGDKVNLIHQSGTGSVWVDETTITNVDIIKGVSATYTGTVAVSEDKKDLVLTLEGGSTPSAPAVETNTLKSMTETRTDVAALVNAAADFMSTTGMQQAKMAAKAAAKAGQDGGAAPFVALGGSHLRYNTGSHVDSNGFNGALGVAKTVSPSVTLGVAGEYGTSDYKSYVGGVRGNGDSKLYGGAVLADWQGEHGWHAESSVRLGRSHTDYSAMTPLGYTNYSDKASYQSVSIGGGKEFKVSSKSNNTVDVYARYMYGHTNGSNAKASSGESIHFAGVNSHRTLVGARYNYELCDSATLYAGAAWMHEFDGDAHSVIGGFTSPSPSLKGNSGMVELGTTFAPCASDRVLLNLNVQGWTGVQRGISGGAGCTIKF